MSLTNRKSVRLRTDSEGSRIVTVSHCAHFARGDPPITAHSESERVTHCQLDREAVKRTHAFEQGEVGSLAHTALARVVAHYNINPFSRSNVAADVLITFSLLRTSIGIDIIATRDIHCPLKPIKAS